MNLFFSLLVVVGAFIFGIISLIFGLESLAFLSAAIMIIAAIQYNPKKSEKETTSDKEVKE